MKGERLIVFNKYGGRCAYCGCELDKSFHVDHLVAIRRRQRYDLKLTKWVDDGCDNPEMDCLENKMSSCPSCNINKHSGSLEDFRQLILGFMRHLNEVNTQYKIAKRYGLVHEDIKPVVFYFETLK